MKRDSSIGKGTSEIRSATFEQVALRRNNRLAELADRKSGDDFGRYLENHAPPL
jgi:hypothetical protein